MDRGARIHHFHLVYDGAAMRSEASLSYICLARTAARVRRLKISTNQVVSFRSRGAVRRRVRANLDELFLYPVACSGRKRV